MQKQSSNFVQIMHCVLICSWFFVICEMFKKNFVAPLVRVWSGQHNMIYNYAPKLW